MIGKIYFFAKKSAFVVLFICITFGLSAQSNKNTWRSLLNGIDLTGWKMVGSKGVAVIIDSAITCNQVANTTEHTFVSQKKNSEILYLKWMSDVTVAIIQEYCYDLLINLKIAIHAR